MFAKILALATVAAVATSYPMYKQCDTKWGSRLIGTSNSTICLHGSLISSVAMALADCGIKTGINIATPSLLNMWLKDAAGYFQDKFFIWGSVVSLGFNFVGKAYS